MANPLPNEQSIRSQIEQEKITIHPLVWQLIEHHINNDLYMINLIVGSTALDNAPLTQEIAGKVINHTEAIKDFLIKLYRLTRPEKNTPAP